MKHLGLFFSFLAIPSLALFVSGCSGGASSAGPTAQLITFDNPGTQTVGAPLTLSATVNSGFAVSFASTTPGVCTVSGTTVTFGVAGTCTIDASVAANGANTAASQTAQSFTVNPAIGATTTIYIVGEAISSSPGTTNQTAAPEEWQLKSGSPTATATPLSVPSGMTGSVASAIVVSGGNVYVAGIVSSNTSQSAVYWVNGTLTMLPTPSGMTNPAAAAIAVSGGDVYVVGSASSSTGTGAAILWVNGTPTTLSPPSGMTDSYASAIAVSGGNVYVVGTASSSDIEKWAAYWVNGAGTLLSRPGGQAIDYYAKGIVVSGGNVYVSGDTDFGVGSGGTAIAWANSGRPTTLPFPSGSMEEDGANDITVSGSNVYVAGYGGQTATYWVNGTPTTLPLPSNMPTSDASYANGIAISGSDVYVVGYAGQSAAYWVNDGEGTLLPMPSGAYKSKANAIAVSTQ
jgi:hypothetical protein